MALNLILIATALAALSGLPGLLCAPTGRGGERLASLTLVAAALFGWTGAAMVLLAGPVPTAAMNLAPAPLAARIGVGVDGLTAFFLLPIFGLGALGAIYGLDYWPQARQVGNGRKLRLFWGLAVAAMAVVTLARQAFVFLAGWEIMAVAAFVLLATEDQEEAVRRSAWLYLIATHLGTLCLFAAFALLGRAVGGGQLAPLAADAAGLGAMYAIFFLALVGFGLKAGIMPLHFWLPGAHANAPSHVSALMSGVVIKMGIYGLLRITSLLPDPPLAWGGLLLALGMVSGVVGVLYALGQHDLKRLLAYHSIENIGIIVMGLGLALIGRSLHRPIWVVLGLSGCLLHVWNHGLFKALLFLGAGSVQHATGTRELDHLGGLRRSMPWTAGLFLIGAVAICGLPPLNGFVSELLIYLGLLRTVGGGAGAAWLPAALGLPVLGLIGALALACFVKVYGAVFLGTARSEAATGAHEPGLRMLGPMALLALACAAIGLAPVGIERPLASAVAAWTGGDVTAASVGALAPLGWISLLGVAGLAAAGSLGLFMAWRRRVGGVAHAGTWSCGYAAPTPRMQYTASSFAQMLVSLFRWVLRPTEHRPQIADLFPAPARFESHVDDAVLDRGLLPGAGRARRWLTRLHRFQQGLTQHYLFYILVAVVALLVVSLPFDRLFAEVFSR